MSAFEPVALDDFLLRGFPREYISATSLKMAVRCPNQWRFRYLLGWKEPPSSALLWGGADHAAVEHNYAQKIESERDLPVSEVKDFFATTLDEKVEEAGGAGEVSWKQDEDQASVKDRGVELVAVYHEQVAPEIFPLTVEEEFWFPLDGLPPLKGYVDIVGSRQNLLMPERSSPFIVERKTKAQNRPPSLEDQLQARIYQLVKPLPLEFQVSVKTKPRVVIHEQQPPEPHGLAVESVRQTILALASFYALYGPDDPWPDWGRTHEQFGKSACEWCGFKPNCEWWRR